MNLQVQQNMNNQTTLQYKWSNQDTYGSPQDAMVQLRSWMIPAEACPGTFVTLKGACGKTTTTLLDIRFLIGRISNNVISLWNYLWNSL